MVWFFGMLADHTGRRLVMAGGLIVLSISYVLYPFSESVTDLLMCRLVYAVGVAATFSACGAAGVLFATGIGGRVFRFDRTGRAVSDGFFCNGRAVHLRDLGQTIFFEKSGLIANCRE